MKQMNVNKKSVKNCWNIVITVIIVGALALPGTVFATPKSWDMRTDTIVSVLPLSQIVQRGESFTVSVHVEPGEPIIGISFNSLSFNASLIQANTVTLEGFFDPYGTFFNPGTIDNVNGEINDVYELTVPPTPVSTPGIFCNISFTAQQEFGTSELNLDGVVISNATGVEVPIATVNASVTIPDIRSIISISPTSQNVERGETFDVSVFVKPGEPIIGVSLDLLSFDPTLIQAVSVAPGDLFNPSIVNPGTIDNINGEITDASALITGGDNVTDNGSFIDITFVARQEFGTSDLELNGAIITNVTSEPAPIIIINGSVTIPEIDTTVKILPINQVAIRGETFTVSIYVEPGERITGITIGKLSFNATLIQANSVTLESFFDPYNTTFSNGTIDNINGEITNIYETISSMNNTSTEGYFCNISFIAQQIYGTSELDLTGVIVADEGGSPATLIVYNGSVLIPEVTTMVNISPSTQIVGKGETFDVSVYVQPGEPLMGIKVDKLYFNQTLVQANSVTIEGFFNPFITFYNDGDIDNVNGEITNINEITIPFNPVSTPGIFCTISFTAQQEFGTSEMDLEGVVIANADGFVIPTLVNDGEVIIADEFTLTVNVFGGGHVDLDPLVGPYLNNTFVELTAVADPGWLFDQWSGDLTGSDNPDTIFMDSNKTVNAIFIDIASPEIYGVTLETSVPLDAIIGWENFSCTVIDNAAVDEVKLILTGNTTMEYLMIKDGDDFYINMTIPIADEYTYYIWANDTSNNVDTSTSQSFDLPLNADVDLSGKVHFLDLAAVTIYYNAIGPNGWIREDVDNSGKVHFLDLVAITVHYNEEWK